MVLGGENVELKGFYNMDCMEGMKEIPDKSVDMILTDIPYGVVNRNDNGLRNFLQTNPYMYVHVLSTVQYFITYSKKYFLTEQSLCSVLDMVKQELLANGYNFKTKDGDNLFLEVKDLLSKYFSKVELYQELPQHDSRFVVTGETYDGKPQYTEQGFAINTQQAQKLSEEAKVS